MKVIKAMSPEERTIVDNISALVEQMKQLGGDADVAEKAHAEPDGDEVMKPNDADADDVKKADREDLPLVDEKKAKKAKLTTGDQAPNNAEPDGDEPKVKAKKSIDAAPTDAAEIDDVMGLLEELPDNEEEAVAQVAKALIAKARARKAAAPVTAKDVAVMKCLTAMTAKLATIEKALGNVIEGTGLADQMVSDFEVAKSRAASQPNQITSPVQNQDMAAMFQMFKSMAAGSATPAPEKLMTREECRKALGQQMVGVLGVPNHIIPV